jgi:hypothetical protein
MNQPSKEVPHLICVAKSNNYVVAVTSWKRHTFAGCIVHCIDLGTDLHMLGMRTLDKKCR